MNALRLTLEAAPFELMFWGVKQLEFRKPSQWIESRILNRYYSHVHFINGYGGKRPYFIAKYNGFNRAEIAYQHTYCNGFTVNVEPGDYILEIGNITQRGQYNEHPSNEIITQLKKMNHEKTGTNRLHKHAPQRSYVQAALPFDGQGSQNNSETHKRIS